MAETAKKTPGTEAVPALGSAAGGLRFELVLPADGNLEDRDDPFVSLSDSGRFSRVLLARIALGDSTLRHLALKVQRSYYRPFGAGQTQITNEQVDEIWQRERENLLSSRSPEVAELLDLGPSLAKSKPVTFCKRTRKYFHPLCPKCARPLEDCKDDSLLRDLGLPAYTESTVRYLACAACAGSGKPTFYTYSLSPEERPKGKVEIRRRTELYRDLATLARGGSVDAGVFPCAGCEHRSTCYPADAGPIPAEQLLVPLSYYEFAALPLELLQLHYDEWVDLLGGAAWAEVRKNAESAAPGRAQSIAPLDGPLSGRAQWMFQSDSAGLFSIEVLRLKLIAFTQLCRGVRALHSKTGHPHLDLKSESAMVVLPAPSRDLAARWNFQTKIINLGSPYRFPELARMREAAGDVFLASPDFQKTYTSPLLRQGMLGQEESMRVTIRSIAPEGSGMRAEMDVLSPKARLQEFKIRDVVRVVATTPVSWLEGVDLWGSIVEPVEGGFRISAYTPRVLGGAKAPVTFDGRVSFHKRVGIPADLYSLGMLLFRTILVNDQRDMFAVEDAIGRVMNKLVVSLEGAIQPDYKYIAGMLHWQVEAEKEVFDPKAVLFAAADRGARASGIPPLLWSDLLLCGFRMVSALPGFSFCGHHADFDPSKPEAPLDAVLQALDQINARLHIELFGTADRDREIQAACNEIIAELTRDGLGAEEKGGLEEAQFQTEP